MNTSAWSPLRQPLFRMLWIAAVAPNVGIWMQNVGGVWLMTSLTPSPLMVALMQTATSLPVFHGRITIPELVTRPDLLGAVTLNGVGVNLARAVGPALGSIVGVA